MKIVLKISIVLIGLILLAGIALLLAMPKQSDGPRKIADPTELDAYFEKITGEGMPPSLSVSVIKNGLPVYQKAFGHTDITGFRPTRLNTIYPWWSVTKLATSVAVLQLVEDGRVNLDSPLTSYFPDYIVFDSEGEPVPITIRQLLNHTSGLPDFMPEGLTWIHTADQKPVNQIEFVREKFVGRLRRLDFEPDTHASYSDEQVAGLSQIMEQKKLFLSDDLTLDSLSEATKIPTHVLSRIINREYRMNFFDYVNSHRIEHFNRLLLETRGDGRTILELALDSGFYSKSTFNLSYKKHMGMTPTQFLSGSHSENIQRERDLGGRIASNIKKY